MTLDIMSDMTRDYYNDVTEDVYWQNQTGMPRNNHLHRIHSDQGFTTVYRTGKNSKGNNNAMQLSM